MAGRARRRFAAPVGPPDARTHQPHRAATGVVAFLTLYQGTVPLVARGLFGAEQRFAPALWLPAPWWWVACLAVTAAGVTLLAALDGRRPGRPAEEAPPPAAGATAEVTAEAPQVGGGTTGYDALEALVFLVGLYNGVAPFVSRLVFDGDLLLALPLRLPSPWWWVASLAVVAATAALLAVIDRAEHGRP
jgi:hypothetical protein